MIRIHAFVSGRVQGVFFRFNTRQTASRLGVTGWVRNLKDGRVEVVAEGEVKAINDFIGFLKNGPPEARVDSLNVVEEEYKGEFTFFNVR